MEELADVMIYCIKLAHRLRRGYRRRHWGEDEEERREISSGI